MSGPTLVERKIFRVRFKIWVVGRYDLFPAGPSRKEFAGDSACNFLAVVEIATLVDFSAFSLLRSRG